LNVVDDTRLSGPKNISNQTLSVVLGSQEQVIVSCIQETGGLTLLIRIGLRQEYKSTFDLNDIFQTLQGRCQDVFRLNG
jgi:hypothetical protein